MLHRRKQTECDHAQNSATHMHAKRAMLFYLQTQTGVNGAVEADGEGIDAKLFVPCAHIQ